MVKEKENDRDIIMEEHMYVEQENNILQEHDHEKIEQLRILTEKAKQMEEVITSLKLTAEKIKLLMEMKNLKNMAILS